MHGVRLQLQFFWACVAVCCGKVLVSGLCPSSSFRDNDGGNVGAARGGPTMPDPIAVAWGRDRPSPITHATSDMVAHIPRQPIPEALGVKRNASACPWNKPGLLNWHDPATWGGVEPSDGDHVAIPPNTSVLISSCSLPENAIFGTIYVPPNSSLVFADANISIHAEAFEVEGSVLIGAATCRLRSSSSVSITLHGSRADSSEKGLRVWGTIEVFGALFTPTWSRLAARAGSGNATLLLQECVNWQRGQRLVVTTTHFNDARTHNFNEERTIASVRCLELSSPGGETARVAEVNLTQPLDHDHYAAAHEYQAEVGLLSRGVVFAGSELDSEPVDTEPVSCSNDKFDAYPCDNTFLTGYGAHLQVLPGGVGHLSAAEFTRMGQTNVLGRYPVHFHLLGDEGEHSYLEDSSIHRSYFRCVVTHGTNGMRVSRNVAFDAIGNCFYFESGNEERNTWDFNLAAHVHAVQHVMTHSSPSSGQDGIDVASFENLTVPADITASAYYLTNLYNTFVGNAAVGGWAGISVPNVYQVMGPERDNSDDFIPMDRPTLLFDGNTIRSSGYYWSRGGCMYVGGHLWFDDPDSDTLWYNGGRRNDLRKRSPIDPVTGDDVWNTFTNLKVSLCGRGTTDWGKRSEWRHLEYHDLRDHSAHAFGDVWLDDVFVQCRSGNDNLPDTGTTHLERLFNKKQYKAFRSYDTGNRHIVTNWQIKDCSDYSTEFPDARMWTVPAGVNCPQFQLIFDNVTYLGQPSDAIVSIELVKSDRFGQHYMAIYDADGSLTRRGKPTIAGPLSAKGFWMLDDANASRDAGYQDCGSIDGAGCCEAHPEWHFPMWACDMLPNRTVTSFEIAFSDKHLDGQKFWSTLAGHINHFGYPPESASPFSYDTQQSGPYNHAEIGGWFLSPLMGAPRSLTITRIQAEATTTLLVAFAYPAATTFVVRATVRKFCSPPDEICEEDFAAVTSADAVRHSPGNTYFFDGTYLFVRLVSMARTSPWRDLGTPTEPWRVAPAEYFARGGQRIPDRGWANYDLTIDADCVVNATEPEYCAGGVVTNVPPPACPEGQVQLGVDKCAVPLTTATTAAIVATTAAATTTTTTTTTTSTTTTLTTATTTTTTTSTTTTTTSTTTATTPLPTTAATTSTAVATMTTITSSTTTTTATTSTTTPAATTAAVATTTTATTITTAAVATTTLIAADAATTNDATTTAATTPTMTINATTTTAGATSTADATTSADTITTASTRTTADLTTTTPTATTTATTTIAVTTITAAATTTSGTTTTASKTTTATTAATTTTVTTNAATTTAGAAITAGATMTAGATSAAATTTTVANTMTAAVTTVATTPTDARISATPTTTATATTTTPNAGVTTIPTTNIPTTSSTEHSASTFSAGVLGVSDGGISANPESAVLAGAVIGAVVGVAAIVLVVVLLVSKSRREAASRRRNKSVVVPQQNVGNENSKKQRTARGSVHSDRQTLDTLGSKGQSGEKLDDRGAHTKSPQNVQL